MTLDKNKNKIKHDLGMKIKKKKKCYYLGKHNKTTNRKKYTMFIYIK